MMVGADAPELWHHGGLEPSSLHEQRLEAVLGALRAGDSRRVLDLGCGSGLLLERLLAQPWLEHVTGADASAMALALARERIAAMANSYTAGRVELYLAELRDPVLAGLRVDAVSLVEMIEHVDPARLSQLEDLVLARLRPATVVITTPNADHNPLLGLAPGQWRHPEHRFEWGRSRFRTWARGVASRHGYATAFTDIGDIHPDLGSPTQMLVLRSHTKAPAIPVG